MWSPLSQDTFLYCTHLFLYHGCLQKIETVETEITDKEKIIVFCRSRQKKTKQASLRKEEKRLWRMLLSRLKDERPFNPTSTYSPQIKYSIYNTQISCERWRSLDRLLKETSRLEDWKTGTYMHIYWNIHKIHFVENLQEWTKIWKTCIWVLE